MDTAGEGALIGCLLLLLLIVIVILLCFCKERRAALRRDAQPRKTGISNPLYDGDNPLANVVSMNMVRHADADVIMKDADIMMTGGAPGWPDEIDTFVGQSSREMQPISSVPDSVRTGHERSNSFTNPLFDTGPKPPQLAQQSSVDLYVGLEPNSPTFTYSNGAFIIDGVTTSESGDMTPSPRIENIPDGITVVGGTLLLTGVTTEESDDAQSKILKEKIHMEEESTIHSHDKEDYDPRTDVEFRLPPYMHQKSETSLTEDTDTNVDVRNVENVNTNSSDKEGNTQEFAVEDPDEIYSRVLPRSVRRLSEEPNKANKEETNLHNQDESNAYAIPEIKDTDHSTPPPLPARSDLMQIPVEEPQNLESSKTENTEVIRKFSLEEDPYMTPLQHQKHMEQINLGNNGGDAIYDDIDSARKSVGLPAITRVIETEAIWDKNLNRPRSDSMPESVLNLPVFLPDPAVLKTMKEEQEQEYYNMSDNSEPTDTWRPLKSENVDDYFPDMVDLPSRADGPAPSRKDKKKRKKEKKLAKLAIGSGFGNPLYEEEDQNQNGTGKTDDYDDIEFSGSDGEESC